MHLTSRSSPALPPRPAPVFWHARTGRFRRTLRALNPLSPMGWGVVLAGGACGAAIVIARFVILGALHP